MHEYIEALVRREFPGMDPSTAEGKKETTAIDVTLKAVPFDMHGRTVYLIAADAIETIGSKAGRLPSRTPCADCGQQAVFCVLEDDEKRTQKDDPQQHGWLWCGNCAVG